MAPSFKRFLLIAGIFLLVVVSLSSYWRWRDDVERLFRRWTGDGYSYHFADDKAVDERNVPFLSRVDKELKLLVEKTQPSVVGIRSKGMIEIGNYYNGKPCRVTRLVAVKDGSGVIVTKEGHVVTNYHVIQGQHTIMLSFHNDMKCFADIVGFDREKDIAVLQIRSRYTYKPLSFGDSDLVEPGQTALSFGNAYGMGIGMTKGSINTRVRFFERLGVKRIQTDVAIHPGHSGGPLLNVHGEIVGLNTDRFVDRESKESIGITNLGFAIPSNVVKDTVEKICESSQWKIHNLGIHLFQKDTGVTYSMLCRHLQVPETGLMIDDIVPNSHAEKVGIQKGDMIIGCNGSTITRFKDLHEILEETRPSESIELVLHRKREGKDELEQVKHTMTIIFNTEQNGHMARFHDLNDLGLRLVSTAVSEDAVNKGCRGMKIKSVLPFSRFLGKLAENDIIEKINGTDIRGRDSLERALKDVEDMVEVQYVRSSQRDTIKVYLR